MEPFPQCINRRIIFGHTIHEVYISCQISQSFSWPFCLNHSLTKKVSSPLNSSNKALIGFLHVSTDQDAKNTVVYRVVMERKPPYMYLFQTCIKNTLWQFSRMDFKKAFNSNSLVEQRLIHDECSHLLTIQNRTVASNEWISSEVWSTFNEFTY